MTATLISRTGRGIGVALLLCLLTSAAWAKPAKVKFSGDVEKKFPNLQVVLDQLVTTLETIELWDKKVMNQRVVSTGNVVNYRFIDIVKHFHGYLTDGNLEITYRPDHDAVWPRAAADTPTGYRINLHNKAGSWDGPSEPYTDYKLARTVFHELVHIWQNRTWMVGNPFTQENSAYFIEKFLPSDLFDSTTYPDPADSADPVPPRQTAKPPPPPPKPKPTVKGVRFDNLFATVSPSRTGEAVVQFHLDGIPRDFPIELSYSGTITGAAVRQRVSGRTQVPGGGYHGSGIGFRLPPHARPGRYQIELQLGVPGQASGGKRRATFDLAPTPTEPIEEPRTPPLKVSLSSQAETMVNRNHTFAAVATGGSGHYQYQWTLPGLSSATVTTKFPHAGTQRVAVLVTDRDDPTKTPARAEATVFVKGELEVSIVAPSQVEAGKRISFSAEVRGGTSPYTYEWTNSAGATSAKPTVSGIARGNPGDEKQVDLQVRDSSTPTPLIATARAKVVLTEAAELDITRMVVSPSVIDQGSSATVTIHFTAPEDGKVTLDGRFETSSGTGRGVKASKTASVKAGASSKVSFRFRAGKKGKPGPLKLRVRLSDGSTSVVKATTATLREPIAMEEAGQNDLVGRYRLSDPKRSTSDYRGVLKLKKGGKGRVRERIKGKENYRYPESKDAQGYIPVAWSYKEGIVTLDFTVGGKWRGLGYFSGPVKGDTRSFQINGKWADGSAGTLRFQKK